MVVNMADLVEDCVDRACKSTSPGRMLKWLQAAQVAQQVESYEADRQRQIQAVKLQAKMVEIQTAMGRAVKAMVGAMERAEKVGTVNEPHGEPSVDTVSIPAGTAFTMPADSSFTANMGLRNPGKVPPKPDFVPKPQKAKE